jgi:hypothetical protein
MGLGNVKIWVKCAILARLVREEALEFGIGASEVPFLDEHARGSWKRTSDALWLTVSIALLILAPFQWFLLR